MSCDHGINKINAKDITHCPWCQLEELDKYFTSANPIMVERATILAKDYWKIRGKE